LRAYFSSRLRFERQRLL